MEPSRYDPRGNIDYQAKEIYQSSTLNEHQLLLLYATAPAFALSTKQWSQSSMQRCLQTGLTFSIVMINMDHVRRLKPSEESLQNLALVDEEALELLRGLSARQNVGARSWSADFIEGKGAGQIVLLHGT